MGFYNNIDNFKLLIEDLLNDREKKTGDMTIHYRWELIRPSFIDENYYLIIHHNLDDERLSRHGYLSLESLNDIVNQLKKNPSWYATIIQGFRLYNEFECKKVYSIFYKANF